MEADLKAIRTRDATGDEKLKQKEAFRKAYHTQCEEAFCLYRSKKKAETKEIANELRASPLIKIRVCSQSLWCLPGPWYCGSPQDAPKEKSQKGGLPEGGGKRHKQGCGCPFCKPALSNKTPKGSATLRVTCGVSRSAGDSRRPWGRPLCRWYWACGPLAGRQCVSSNNSAVYAPAADDAAVYVPAAPEAAGLRVTDRRTGRRRRPPPLADTLNSAGGAAAASALLNMPANLTFPSPLPDPFGNGSQTSGGGGTPEPLAPPLPTSTL